MSQNLLDWLFRLHIYWGTKVKPPPDLIEVSMINDSNFTETYKLDLDEKTELGSWLMNECEGPWTIVLSRPARKRQTYVYFARVADAVIFRLRQS